MLKAVQGFEFSAQAPAGSAQMVISDGANRYVVGADGGGRITASAEETRGWAPGKYSYQILSPTGIEEEGALRVKANFLISADPLSYWRKALKAVEDRITGKTLDPANDVTVGDKRISYSGLTSFLGLGTSSCRRWPKRTVKTGRRPLPSLTRGRYCTHGDLTDESLQHHNEEECASEEED